jgi:flavin-dependent dehydrogenase
MSAKGVVEKSLYGDNIMIIGDAAGFVSPISGEGIHPSIVSGQIAAETAIQALEKEDISKNTLRGYKTHHNIKKIISNFKLKRSLVEFFYEQGGKNLNTMFNLAEVDNNFKSQVIDMFFFNAAPSQDFFAKIRGRN